VIGHNPGTHALALGLTGSGNSKSLAQLALGFPTAGLAVIDFEAEGWDRIKAGQGKLRAFVTPKGL
jgi:phosphohistidine phosphatase